MQNATPTDGRHLARIVEALRLLGYRPEQAERTEGEHRYAGHVEPWLAACPACYVAFGEVERTLTVGELVGLVCWSAELQGGHRPGLVEELLGLDRASTPALDGESPTTPRPSSVPLLRPPFRHGL